MFLIVLTEIRLQRSFDDWQRTAFQSVVGAPDSSFSQIFKGLTASPKRARICSRVTGGARNGIEKVRQGTLRSRFSARIWGRGLRGSTDSRSTNYYRSSALQYAARNGLFLEKPSAGPKAGQCARLKYSYVRAMIYAGSVKRGKASVAGIGTVL